MRMHVWNTETRYLSWAGIIGNWGGNLRIEDGLLWARSLGLFEGLRLHVPFQINLSHGWVSIILVKNLWQDICICRVRKITICVQNNMLAIFFFPVQKTYTSYLHLQNTTPLSRSVQKWERLKINFKIKKISLNESVICYIFFVKYVIFLLAYVIFFIL